MIVVGINLNALADKHLEVPQTLLSLIEPVGKEKGCKNYNVFAISMTKIISACLRNGKQGKIWAVISDPSGSGFFWESKRFYRNP